MRKIKRKIVFSIKRYKKKQDRIWGFQAEKDLSPPPLRKTQKSKWDGRRGAFMI